VLSLLSEQARSSEYAKKMATKVAKVLEEKLRGMMAILVLHWKSAPIIATPPMHEACFQNRWPTGKDT
jgi:hypothetical protein